MDKCSQCGNVPMYNYQGHPLCLACYTKVSQNLQNAFRANAAMINFLSGSMDSMIGLPVSPRFEIPSEPQTNINQNYIMVDRSVIGAINTGTINTLNNSMNKIYNLVNPELANLLAQFTEAILKNQELKEELKQELIDNISFLSDQILTPQGRQNKTLITRTVDFIKDNISTLQNLMTMWPPIYESLKHIFDFLS